MAFSAFFKTNPLITTTPENVYVARGKRERVTDVLEKGGFRGVSFNFGLFVDGRSVKGIKSEFQTSALL